MKAKAATRPIPAAQCRHCGDPTHLGVDCPRIAKASRPSPLAKVHAVYGMEGLDAKERAVLLAMCYRAGESWPKCWAGHGDLSRLTAMSVSSCRRACESLKARGLLSWEARWKGRERDSNLYKLLFAAPPVKPLVKRSH